MSKRADEMRRHRLTFEFAMRHGIDLAEAKRRMANIRRAQAEDFIENLHRCGTATRPRPEPDQAIRSSKQDLFLNDAPWMMRD